MLKKILPIIGLTVMMFTFSHADVADTVAELGKHAMDKMTEVALKDKTETIVSDIQQEADIDMKQAGVLGDVGNKIDGDKVHAEHVVQKAKIKMEQAVVVGDVGNHIGSR